MWNKGIWFAAKGPYFIERNIALFSSLFFEDSFTH